MKKNIKYLIYGLCASTALFVSCVSDTDYETPPFKQPFYVEDFTNQTPGSSTTYEPVTTPDAININLSETNTEAWGVRRYNNDNYMQFASNFSPANTKDNVWFILPPVDLSVNDALGLNFTVAQAYPNGKFPLTVYYSTDFNGDPANITSSAWTALPFNFPATSTNFTYVKIKDLTYLNESTETQKVYFAFNYVGAKTDLPTTTIQVDNIKLTLN